MAISCAIERPKQIRKYDFASYLIFRLIHIQYVSMSNLIGFTFGRSKNSFLLVQDIISICFTFRRIYPSPSEIAKKILKKSQNINVPFTPILYKMKAKDLCQFETIVNHPAREWINKAKEIAHSNYKSLTHPHLCEKCGDSNHEKGDCPYPTHQLKCLYPFCCPATGSKNHMTKICPTVIATCKSCNLTGHHATHHGTTEFDVFVAYNTQKLFSFVHVIGSLMNHQDMVFASNQSGFHPFLPSLKRL